MQIYNHSPRVIVMDLQFLLTFDNNRIFDIFINNFYFMLYRSA